MNAETYLSKQGPFIERFMSTVSKVPNNAAIIEVDSGKSVTYQELDALSGRVYRFLSDRGIGKDDVVMVFLPRGIAPFIVNIGVWKAGAAVVLLEINNYSEQNKEYIYQDCNCKLLIDQDVFDAMMGTETKSGYEHTNLHDLAYIVYTSGSTGRPKGVMQEFGLLNLCADSISINGENMVHAGDVFAMITPLSFVASSMSLQISVSRGVTLAIPPLSYVRNPALLAEKLKECHTNIIFMTQSYFRLFADKCEGYRMILLSAEPVHDACLEGIPCFEFYCQTESGQFTTIYRLEGSYETAPLGKHPLSDELIRVVDEQNNVLKGEAIGEMCYWNPFFRGYLGLDELTKNVTDGTFVHSGDIVHREQDGTLFYIGRKDDMLKIHGNRVEPSEVEHKLIEVLGVKWAAVRAFTDNDRTVICAYYTGIPKISIEEAKELLRQNLADYMVPGIFMHIDEIPVGVNGKFSRRLLPVPELNKSDLKYKAPSTDAERLLCDAMAKVLGMKEFGASDDFYELGGDSLRSIRLIMELGWERLEASMIFQGRTPEKIARLYEEALADKSYADAIIRNKNALLKDYPLTLEQQYMFDYQQHVPESTTWNLSFLLSFQKELDILRVRDAVLKTIKNHPIFSLIYCFNENKELVQRYVPEAELSLEIEKTTESEFADTVKTLVKPFDLLDSPLYRIRIFETEQKGYLFLDMHHSIVDGNSLHIIQEDIQRAYAGEELEEDFYFLNLEERRMLEESPLCEEGRAYYEKTLDRYDWECYPTLDYDSNDYRYGCEESYIPITQDKYDAIYKMYGLSKNAFYIAVTLLAIGSYNRKDNVKLSWVFHGREKAIERHIVGTLIKEFYVGIHIEKQTTLKAFFDEIRRQIQMSMKYSCYPYPGIERMNEEGEDTSLIYQYDLMTFISGRKLPFTMEDLPVPKSVADNLLDIEIREVDKGCNLFMEYNGARYKEESMRKFSSLLIHTACLLIEKTDKPQCTLGEISEELLCGI